MTIAVERTRSLHLGRGSLLDICRDDTVDVSHQSRAQLILGRYPEDSEIQRWAEGDLEVIPEAAAQALASTAKLFREVWHSNTGGAQMRHRLLYTRRHFPEAEEFSRWTQVLPFSRLTDWLA